MIGVVGPDAEGERLADALSETGGSPRRGSAREVTAADPDAVVAIGEPAVLDLVRAGVGVPVLPVSVGPGLGSVSVERAAAAAGRLVAGDHATRHHPLLGVEADGERAGEAVFDAALIASEPGRISEYAVAADGVVDRFRADGVVVATPAGSHGYARAAGGPLVNPESGAVAVVPVAAFSMRSDVRVADPEAPLSLSVERGEVGVSLLVDDREVRRVGPDEPVSIRAVGGLETIRLRKDGG